MSKLTKKEFIDAISEITGESVTKATIDKVLHGLSETITTSVKNGDQVVLPDIGSFEMKQRAARKGRNPQTGAEIQIAASNYCAFKPVKKLKDSLN
jgi:DNA-binding protein HU-beta